MAITTNLNVKIRYVEPDLFPPYSGLWQVTHAQAGDDGGGQIVLNVFPNAPMSRVFEILGVVVQSEAAVVASAGTIAYYQLFSQNSFVVRTFDHSGGAVTTYHDPNQPYYWQGLSPAHRILQVAETNTDGIVTNLRAWGRFYDPKSMVRQSLG